MSPKPGLLIVCLCLLLPQPVWADTRADRVELAGDILQVLIPAAGYGATFYLDDKPGRGQFYRTFLTTTAATQILKHSTDRTRPNGRTGHSFPSGHTSAAFQGASFIHRRYGLAWGTPAYLGASFVGYSRLKSNNHHRRDIVGGALIGILPSLVFVERYEHVQVSPELGEDYFGIRLDLRW